MGSHTLPAAPENKDFNELRLLYPEFIYKGYTIVKEEFQLEVSYQFSIPGLCDFNPTLSFPRNTDDPTFELDEHAERIVFNIGMIELISYWKTTCSPRVRILDLALSAEQIDFWTKLYYGGLGEFFYRNEIETTFDSFMTIEAEGLDKSVSAAEVPLKENKRAKKPGDKPERILVPVGGGKDSVVSLCRLAGLKDELYGFAINPIQAAIDTMETAGIRTENRLFVQRTLDKNMLELNRLGYWNGHTPFSAVVAFVSLYVAYCFDLDYIVLSNEASANEATVSGTDVNHQFSKSTAFEEAFQSYVEQWIGLPIYYFSLMRPFSELAIAREFARHSQYFPIFRSCNVGSKQNRWCGACAKCLFVATVLRPFLSEETVTNIIGKNLFDSLDLLDDFAGLCGRLELKPWECVGTVSEVNTAVTMTICQYLDQGVQRSELPILYQRYMLWVSAGEVSGVFLTGSGRPITVVDEAAGPLQRFNTDHRVPALFLPYIETMLGESAR